MISSFNVQLKNLRRIANQFDEPSLALKSQLLKSLSKTALPIKKSLEDYQHLLLFLSAHAHNEEFRKRVISEMNRLAKQLKRTVQKAKEKLENTGLPFTTTLASLTHDLLIKLNGKKELKLSYYSSEEENIELNQLLSFTLPDIEKDYTTAGASPEDLLDLLQVKESEKLNFILQQLEQLNPIPFIKDFLLDKFNLYVAIEPKSDRISKAFNKIPVTQFYYHSDILKKFDHLQLINTPLPKPRICNEQEKDEIIEAMQMALYLLARETDPCTFIDKNSLRIYDLERGISVALFGMIPERQLSMESYVGYTLFKNGYPCAYGGGWVYGTRSLFGINIFEQFRGGESGFILMQLLRTYKQAFGLNYFEVEPYQYGLDNPEGIESGAFWFYYCYGFRPLDKDLNKLAHAEAEKIKTKKDYRSSTKTLTRFTESNIGWLIDGKVPPAVTELRAKITKMIAKKYGNDRRLAIEKSILSLREKVHIHQQLTKAEMAVLKDLALVVEVINLNDKEKLETIVELIKLKSADIYLYNEKLKTLLN